MRELSRREFFLVLFFPGLLIAGVYYFAFESAAQTSQKQLQGSVNKLDGSLAGLNQSIVAREKVPVPPISSAQEEIVLVSRQIEVEKNLAAINAHPWLMAPVRWTSVSARIDASHAISSIFGSHRLIVLSSQRDDDSHKVIPKELEDFAGAVQNDGNHPIPQVWRVDAIGSYRDVLASLDELGRRDAFIIPLAVQMQLLPDDPKRQRWMLWIWI